MRTKIVYVLVSEETDYYYEMFLMSLYSLRLYHLNDEVIVVADEDTYYRLQAKKDPLLAMGIKYIQVSIPLEYNKTLRSRYLKTQLRQYIEDNFLYIDCDTIICGRLDSIDNIEVDLATVYDLHYKQPLTAAHCKKFINHFYEFQLEGEPLFNSGLIYAKSTPEIMRFYVGWHQYWKESVTGGEHKDMPALCKINSEMGHIISELPDVWNCQISTVRAYPFIRNCKILHYFGGVKNRGGRLIYKTLKQVKEKQSVSGIAKFFARHPHSIGYLIMVRRKAYMLYGRISTLHK